MESLLKAFTFLPKAEIERLVEESKTNPGKREAQKTLAWEVTSFVHGEAATQAAIDASGALFGRGGNLEDIDEETLESVLDGFKVVDENGEHVFPRLQARRSRNRRRPGCRTVQVRFRGTPRHQVRWRVSQQQPYRG